MISFIKDRILLVALLFLTIIFILYGLFVIYIQKDHNLIFAVGKPLVSGLPFLLAVLIIFCFLSKKVFNAWLFPGLMILLTFTLGTANSEIPSSCWAFCDRYQVAGFSGIFFLLASIVFIILYYLITWIRKKLRR